MRPQPLHQLWKVHRAGLSSDLTTALEHRRRGDTADAVALAQYRAFVRVHLGKPDLGLELRGCGFEEGRHHLAGPAPRCPEVHDEREIAPPEVPVEALVRQGDWMPGEERPLALPALGLFVQPSVGDPVRRLATGAHHDGRGTAHLAKVTMNPARSRVSHMILQRCHSR